VNTNLRALRDFFFMKYFTWETTHGKYPINHENICAGYGAWEILDLPTKNNMWKMMRGK